MQPLRRMSAAGIALVLLEIVAFVRFDPATLDFASTVIGFAIALDGWLLVVVFKNIRGNAGAKHSVQDRFRLAVNSCPSGIIMLDRQSHVVMVNAQIERLFGYSAGELIGQPLDFVFPQQAEAIAADTGGNRELLGRRKDGTRFPACLKFNQVQTTSGALAVGTVADASEQSATSE